MSVIGTLVTSPKARIPDPDEPAQITLREPRRIIRRVSWPIQRTLVAALRHGIRVIHPVTLVRATTAELRGLGLFLRWLHDWLNAKDKAELKIASKSGPKIHHQITRERLFAAGFFLLLLTGGLGYLWLLFGDVVWASTITVAVIGLYGWGRNAPSLVPAPDLSPLTPGESLVKRAVAQVALNADLDKHPELADKIKVRRPVQRDGDAWRCTVDLPGSTTAAKLVQNREALASALGVSVIQCQVVADPDGDNAGRAELWVATRDPWKTPPTVSPLIKGAVQKDIWRPQTFGKDVRGREVLLNLPFNNFLFGGLPRQGKTVSANNVTAAVMLDPRARIWGADGKELDTRPIVPMMHRFVGADPEGLLEMLDEMHVQMRETLDVLKQHKLSKVNQKFCDQTGTGFEVLLVDELAFFTAGADPKLSNRIVQRLRVLAEVGPAAGIILILATQRPASKVVDPSLRDLIHVRFGLRTSTWQMSETILGSGTKVRGADASEFEEYHKGVGILKNGASFVVARSHLLEVEDLDTIAAAAMKIRRAAGVLPGQATRPTMPPILEAIREVFQALAVDRLRSADLANALARHPEWEDIDPVWLAAQVRQYGLEPKQLGGQGNPRGYTLSDVEQAATGVLSGR